MSTNCLSICLLEAEEGLIAAEYISAIAPVISHELVGDVHNVTGIGTCTVVTRRASEEPPEAQTRPCHFLKISPSNSEPGPQELRIKRLFHLSKSGLLRHSNPFLCSLFIKF